jgi:hypothetical protein
VLLQVVLILLVCLAITAVLIVVALRIEQRHKAERAVIEERFRALGEALGAREEDGALALSLDGRPFVLRLVYVKSRATGIEVETIIDGGRSDQQTDAPVSSQPGPISQGPTSRGAGEWPRVLLRRETWADRLGKALRINREVQTGDEAFDAQVYLESDANDAAVARVLRDARVRRGVLSLLSRGGDQVVINEVGQRITLTYDPRRPLEADDVRAACEELRTVARALPLFREGESPSTWLSGVLTTTVSVVAAFAGFVAAAWARDAYYPLGHDATRAGIVGGLVAWLLAMPVVAALVRGRSGSFRVFVTCFFLLLAALPLGGVGMAVGLNGSMDGAAPVDRRARVHSKWAKTYKNGITYYMRLDGLEQDSPEVVLPVPHDVYAGVHEGDDVVVRVGPGRFGWKWLQGIRRPGNSS